MESTSIVFLSKEIETFVCLFFPKDICDVVNKYYREYSWLKEFKSLNRQVKYRYVYYNSRHDEKRAGDFRVLRWSDNYNNDSLFFISESGETDPYYRRQIYYLHNYKLLQMYDYQHLSEKWDFISR